MKRFNRRDFLVAGAALAGASGIARWARAARTAEAGAGGSAVFDEVVAKVIPEQGFRSRIKLGDSAARLAGLGVIDRAKLEKLYAQRGGFPPELREVLSAPVDQPIALTAGNAGLYVNLLWPLGLANYMFSNLRSPINGPSLAGFASTGGWTLGREANGAAYFNKFNVVELTPEQEALVMKVATNTYRPCCNNSTFFQDCNHGSALLGLLQLGASQGLAEDDLYRETVAFNSFWFPRQYVYNALYFKAVKGEDWENVDPRTVMGTQFSSASGSARIQAEVARIPNLVPKQQGEGASCGA